MWKLLAKLKSKWFFLFFVGIACFTACGDSASPPVGIGESDTATASFSLRLSKVATETLSLVEVVITAGDMVEIKEDLIIQGEIATGVVEVPAGINRRFVLNGYDSNGNLIYTGGKRTDVIAGKRIQLEIEMFVVGTEGNNGSESIPGLHQISLERYPGFELSNWDSDMDFDGITNSIEFLDDIGGVISLSRLRFSVRGNIKMFLAIEQYGSLEKADETPYVDYNFKIDQSDETIYIPFGAYMDNVDEVFVTVDYYGKDVIDSIVELQIFFADETFSVRQRFEVPIRP